MHRALPTPKRTRPHSLVDDSIKDWEEPSPNLALLMARCSFLEYVLRPDVEFVIIQQPCILIDTYENQFYNQKKPGLC